MDETTKDSVEMTERTRGRFLSTMDLLMMAAIGVIGALFS